MTKFSKDVGEHVKRKARRQKAYTLPAAKDMPPVEVVQLDGTRVAGDRHLQYGVMLADGAFAWLHIASSLDELARHPKVIKSPVAVEFVQTMRALVDGALLADDARQVLVPIDTLLPMGEMGDKHSKEQALRRKGKPARMDGYDNDRNARICRHHRALVKGGRHDATKQTADDFGLSPRQVSRIVNAP